MTDKNKDALDLAKRLEIKADMINRGERIEWGSDSAIMKEAAAFIRAALQPTTPETGILALEALDKLKDYLFANAPSHHRFTEIPIIRAALQQPPPLQANEDGSVTPVQHSQEIERKDIVAIARNFIERWDNGLAVGTAMQEMESVIQQHFKPSQSVDVDWKALEADLASYCETPDWDCSWVIGLIKKHLQSQGHLNTQPNTVDVNLVNKILERADKIHKAVNFMRYGDKVSALDGEAMADVYNHTSAIKTFVMDLKSQNHLNQGWQPIETAPKDRPILVIGKKGYGIPYVAVWGNVNKKFDYDFVTYTASIPVVRNKATHWMPLPQPPKSEGVWKNKQDTITYRPEYQAYNVVRMETYIDPETGESSKYETAAITVTGREGIVNFCQEMLVIWDKKYGSIKSGGE